MAGVYRHPPFTRARRPGFEPALDVGSANGTATPSGVTAASAVGAVIGNPAGVPAGQTVASAENNPFGNPAGVPSGQSVASAENNPTATGAANVSVSGQTAASAENNPLGNPAGVPNGQSAASAENNPIGSATAVVSGQSVASAENNPTATDAEIATPSGQTVASAEHNPSATGSAVATPAGVSATAAENNPTTNQVTGAGWDERYVDPYFYGKRKHSQKKAVKKQPQRVIIVAYGETVQAQQSVSSEGSQRIAAEADATQPKQHSVARGKLLMFASGRTDQSEQTLFSSAELIDVEMEMLLATLLGAA